MTQPIPPSDTDRIIAAADAQAHKTRVLLVWLLLGIPAAVALVWVIVIGVSAASQTSTVTGITVDTPDPMPTALLGTIESTTSCRAVNSYATDEAENAYTGGFISGVRGRFQDWCSTHPDDLAAAALAYAYSAPTPTD